MSNVALAAAVLLAFAVVGLSIWLLPHWQARGWRRAGITDETKLAELSVQARTGITQAFGGLAPHVPSKKLMRDGCATYRLPPADIVNVLTFVLPDVAAALLRQAGKPRLPGLRGTDLRRLGLDGLILQRLDLTGIRFDEAALENAHFGGSFLPRAHFERARLTNADFGQTRLQGSSFNRACLAGTDFSSAHLQRADFRGAKDLNAADFTSAEMDGAKFTRSALAHTNLSTAQKRVVVTFG